MNKYLIEDSGNLYTVSAGALVQISGTLSASLFQSDGFDDLTDVGNLLITMSNPQVHAWSDTAQPNIQASVESLPFPQDIVTHTVNLIASEIVAISDVVATYTGNPLIAVDLDGMGYQKYSNGAWVAASDHDGMSIADMQAISENTWTDFFDGAGTFTVRITLASATDALNSFQIIFLIV